MEDHEMNEELSPPIATGGTADIHPWQDTQVLKLFFDKFSLEDVEYEKRISQAVHASGLPVPAAGEIIQKNNRYGLIYERVEGISMLDMFLRKPWNAVRYAHRMAELHAEMHGITFQEHITQQRERIKRKINQVDRLDDDLRMKLLAALDQMPDGTQLCHGDFHPGNIMMAGQQTIIIDWIDATLGNPLADVARTSIILLGVVHGNLHLNFMVRAFVLLFHHTYLRRYFKLHPGGREEYAEWLPIVAAARLSENIKEFETYLLAQAQKV
jgi:uncharacterized protein (TIGR02172 family)